MTLKECQEKIDSREYSLWLAEYNIEPWGEARLDLDMAILASTVANILRGKDDPIRSPKDFMPDFEPNKHQSEEEMLLNAMKFVAVMGGEFK